GRFFAEKLRAAALFALFERTGDEALRGQAVARYRSARGAWARIVEATRGVYMDDVSYGSAWYQRGHWADRGVAIERDIAALASGVAPTPAAARLAARTASFVAAVTAPGTRPAWSVRHLPPASFRRGQPLALEIAVPPAVESVVLLHRPAHQARAWTEVV